MNLNGNPQYSYTIQDFITQGQSIEMTYYNLSLLEKYKNDIEIEFSSNNIIYDYIDELLKLSKDVILSNEEFKKYKYNPQLLSYDIYGTTDLSFVLLAINGTCNMKEFNNRKIKALYKSDLFDILSEIYNAESDSIKFNRYKIENNESSF